MFSCPCAHDHCRLVARGELLPARGGDHGHGRACGRRTEHRNSAITTLIEASGIASVVGLLIGSIGLAFVIVERSRQ